MIEYKSSSSNGEIITFYSYKGGTGRSMALANVACLLSRDASNIDKMNKKISPKGILMIDWDLEAPGLHRYFEDEIQYKNFQRRSFFQSQLGLIDLFYAMRSGLELHGEESTDKFFARLRLRRFIVKTNIPYLFLMTAGKFDQKYSARVNEFNWSNFFESFPLLIPRFAEYLSRKFNYVLIDSRTGYSDISGICTSILPEKLVAVFTPNRQSLTGVLEIARQSTEYRKQSDDLRKLIVFPLPSRIEPAEPDLRKYWRFASNKMGGILLVTSTKIETKAVLDVFSSDRKWVREYIGTKTYYRLGEFGGVNVNLVQSEIGTDTDGGSFHTIAEAISNIEPSDIISIGLSIGIDSNKQVLGDIIVSKQISYYLPQINSDNQFSRVDLQATSSLIDKFRSGDNDWNGAIVHFGHILSGDNIINDLEITKKLSKFVPPVIGIEMEGAGISMAASEAGIGWILVRGISDLKGRWKNDGSQQLAANNAAKFVLHVLKLGGWRHSKKPLSGYQPEFEAVFKEVYNLDKCSLTKYFDNVQIQHVPKYSYGEDISVLVESGNDRLSLANSFENFTQLLTKSDVPWDENKDIGTDQKKYDVFLSYSSKDTAEANEIYLHLNARNMNVFMAENDIMPGMNLENVIKEVLISSKVVCVLLTPNSLTNDWVMTEWAVAWALDIPLLPVLYRVLVNQIPERLQRYKAIDFHEISKIEKIIDDYIQ